jgi:4-diphosphocytidyl-2-C-methyl-D-erythritol kinase
MPECLAAFAPAKLNLMLRIAGRRSDGYHDLISLVAFAPFGDELVLRPGAHLTLAVRGPTADTAGPLGDNLVLRAARMLADRIAGLRLGGFELTKCLPAGAGLGGGSADAAAALRLIARANGLGLDDPRLYEAARVTGADVPVCIDPQPKMMSGIGEVLSPPLRLPRLGVVVVHPGLAVSTAKVFASLGLAAGERLVEFPPDATGVQRAPSSAPPAAETRCVPSDPDALLAWLGSERNDLQAPAIAIAPAIAEVLDAIAALPNCRLARMSGSGSACFGLFDDPEAATGAMCRLNAARPNWWARAGSLAT